MHWTWKDNDTSALSILEHSVARGAAEPASLLSEEGRIECSFRALKYLRTIMEGRRLGGPTTWWTDCNLRDLLRNNLVLGQDYNAGKEQYPNRFFCGTIDAEDLPWDPTEKEW